MCIVRHMKLTHADLEDWASDGEVFVQSQSDMEHAHCLRSASEHLVLSIADRNPKAIQGRFIFNLRLRMVKSLAPVDSILLNNRVVRNRRSVPPAPSFRGLAATSCSAGMKRMNASLWLT